MVLHFQGGKTVKVKTEKKTKKYTYVYCHANTMRYRINNESGEVQDATYKRVIKGLWVE